MANRILHATDFSAASGPAFRQAIAMARRDRAELLVLHVLSPPAPMVADAYITPNVWNTLLRSQRASAQRLHPILQWSPDLAAGETSARRARGARPSVAFNGAPTSRPGKP